MWNQHMHLRYELIQVTKPIISKAVQGRMAEVKTEKEKMLIYKRT